MNKLRSIGQKLALLNRYSHTYFSESLQEYGIHGGGQIRIIMALSEHTTPMSQECLATILEVDKASISRMIRPLVQNGLVDRVQDPRDKRAYLVKIAETVQEKIPIIIDKAKEWSFILTRGLDEEAYTQLYQYLEILEENAYKFLKEGDGLEKKS